MRDRDELLMHAALEEARRAAEEGNEPYGAVVADGSRIVALGRNLVATTVDVTAHSEIVAIRAACEAIGRTDLSGLSIYTSYEPCPMCCGAILASSLDRLVVAASGYSGEHYGGYSARGLLALIGPTALLAMTSGVLQAESRAIITAWSKGREPLA